MIKDKILFICRSGVNRSRTASFLLNELGYNTDYTGLSYADEKLPDAQIVVFMESDHIKFVEEFFPEMLKNKKIFCLNIPDNYEFNEPNLRRIILKKIKNLGLLK